MGKTYKRNKEYRPKQHGKIFVKDKDKRLWNKNKQSNIDDNNSSKNKEFDQDIDPFLE